MRRKTPIILLIFVLFVLALSACTKPKVEDTFASYRYGFTSDTLSIIAKPLKDEVALELANEAISALADLDYRVRGSDGRVNWELRMSGTKKASLIKKTAGLIESWYAKGDVLYHNVTSENGSFKERYLATRPDFTHWLMLAGEESGFSALLYALSSGAEDVEAGYGSQGELIIQRITASSSARIVAINGVLRYYIQGTVEEASDFTVKFTKTNVIYPRDLSSYPWKYDI